MGRFSRAERRPPPGALSWASHPPQSPAATGGARAAVPETSAALVSGQRRAASPSPPALLSASAGPSVRHPPPHRPWPRPRGAARTGGRDKVAPGLSPAAICSPQPRLLHRWWGRRRGEPGERYFSMGLPGHCGEGRAAGLARALRTQTSAPRPRGSVAPGRGVPAPQVGGERRPSRLSVRPSARPLARSPRAHRAHAPAHSPAPHTPASPAPPLCPGSCGLSHPARAPPQAPVATTSTPAIRTGARGAAQIAAPVAPRLRSRPSPRPARRGPGLPGAAHTPRARPGHEARRKGRRRACGWHGGSPTGAPTLPRVPHPSPPPPLQHKRLQEEWRSPSNLPLVQGSAGSSLARGRRPRSQGRARRGAAAPRCGQRPPAEPAGSPLLSYHARRQLRPAVVPPPPPPPPACPPPPAGCGGEAGKRRARLLRQARTLGWRGAAGEGAGAGGVRSQNPRLLRAREAAA